MSFIKKIVKGAKNVLEGGDSVDKGKTTASSQANNVFRYFKTNLILYMAWVCGGISNVK